MKVLKKRNRLSTDVESESKYRPIQKKKMESGGTKQNHNKTIFSSFSLPSSSSRKSSNSTQTKMYETDPTPSIHRNNEIPKNYSEELGSEASESPKISLFNSMQERKQSKWNMFCTNPSVPSLQTAETSRPASFQSIQTVGYVEQTNHQGFGDESFTLAFDDSYEVVEDESID